MDEQKIALENIMGFYFKTSKFDADEIFGCAINRAYLDLCRTLGGISKADTNSKNAFYLGIMNDIRSEIVDNPTCADFSVWHERVCEKIVTVGNRTPIFAALTCNFSYGHAQKWVNMTLKYLLLFGLLGYSNTYTEFAINNKASLHIPVDSFVIREAKKLPNCNELVHAGPHTTWSKMTKEEYIQYQADIRAAIMRGSQYEYPLMWELEGWPTWVRN